MGFFSKLFSVTSCPIAEAQIYNVSISYMVQTVS